MSMRPTTGHRSTPVSSPFPCCPIDSPTGSPHSCRGKTGVAIIIEFLIQHDGSFTPGEVHRALVRNKAKLVYEEVGEWLEGTRTHPEGY